MAYIRGSEDKNIYLRGLEDKNVYLRGTSRYVFLRGLKGQALLNPISYSINVIGAGYDFSLAGGTNNNGEYGFFSWGLNSTGELGDNTITNKSTPIAVYGTHTFNYVNALLSHTLALDNNNLSWGWGSNSFYQAGNPTFGITSILTPYSINVGASYCRINAGNLHSLAIDTTGQAWAWGYNSSNGQLGDNTTTSKRTPVQVCGTHIFREISAGYNVSAGIDNNGKVWCWGGGAFGALGNNTSEINSLTPTSIYDITGKTFTQIVSGYYMHIALDNTGKAWAWGYNNRGQLGNNTVTNKSTPIAICGNHTFNKIVIGGSINTGVLGIDINGQAWGWGINTGGMLGDNTTTSRRTPVQVCGNHTFCNIAMGPNHSLGVDHTGKLWSWGSNSNGQLGLNTLSITSERTPVRVCL